MNAVKNIGNLLKTHLLQRVPSALREEFERRALRANMTSLPIMAALFVVVQICGFACALFQSPERFGFGSPFFFLTLAQGLWQIIAICGYRLFRAALQKRPAFLYVHIGITLVLEMLRVYFLLPSALAYFHCAFLLALITLFPLIPRGISALLPGAVVFASLAVPGEGWVLPAMISFSVLLILLRAYLTSENILSFLQTHALQEECAKLEQANAQLLEISQNDPLTQVYNRRTLNQKLEYYAMFCSRAGLPLSMLLIDLDNFQAYNKDFGRAQGDDCLLRVAQAVRSSFQRKVDIVARFDGDEFAVLLPFEPLDRAVNQAERVRKNIVALGLTHPKSSVGNIMTVSVGVACCNPDGSSDPYALADMASAALHIAKKNGRNIVSSADNIEAAEAALNNLEEARLSELQCLRIALESATLLTFTFDFHTNECVFSDAIYELCDIPTNTFRSYEELARIIVREDIPSIQDMLEDMRRPENRTASHRDIQVRILLRGGACRWALMRSVIQRSSQGQPRLAIGSLIDITELAHMRDAHQLLSEATSAYTFSYDARSNTARFSLNFLADFGLDGPLKSARRALTKMVFPPDRRKFRNALVSILRGKNKDAATIIRMENPQSSVIYLRFQGRALWDYAGKLELIVGSMTDITSEIEMRKTNRLIIEAANECLFMMNLPKNSMQISPKIRDMLPVPSLYLQPAREIWAEMVFLEDRERYLSILDQLISGDMDHYSLEYRLYGRGGRLTWISMRGMSERDDNGRPAIIVGAIFDLASMGQYNQHIEQFSLLDPLTGQPNRFSFHRDMQDIIDSGGHGYIIMLDLDDFKRFNSMYSHSHGDKLLKDISNILKAQMPDRGYVYRFESDLFGLVIADADRAEVEAWMRGFKNRYPVGIPAKNADYWATLSMGAVEYSSGYSVDELLMNADIAIQKAKSQGKGSYVVFSTQDRKQYLSRLELDEQLRRAVDAGCNEFELHYQSLYSKDAETLVGSEALLRFRAANGDILLPLAFLQNLEDIGLMPRVENWVLRTAIGQCAQWRKHPAMEDFVMNVNLSSAFIQRPELFHVVTEALLESNLPPHALTLEITESAYVLPMKDGLDTLYRLREYGVNVAIDDFGTGYSSLSYLKRLPVTETKIDRSFVLEIESDISAKSFVASIIQLAHSLNHTVCVEGVETAEQAEMLIDIGADILQGYYFSRPIPADVFEESFILNR